MKKIIHVSMIVSLFALLVSCGGGAKSPGAVSKSFIEKIEKGDTKAAAQMFEGMKNATDEEIQKTEAFLSESTKEMASKGGVKSIKVLSESISEDGQKADVELKVTYGNGEEDESTTKLNKTEDGWKITMGK